MNTRSRIVFCTLIALIWLPAARAQRQAKLSSSLLRQPDSPVFQEHAPDSFDVHLETSKGLIVIAVRRDWSPRGADRFYHLVRAGYYDQVRFHRVIAGKWAQFGINGDPKISTVWRTQMLSDEPRQVSNERGTVAYAFAVPNGRTTQIFFNLRDNAATHDKEPFVPFGKITKGLDVADALYAEYGETSGGGIRGGKQAPLFESGNAWLQQNFPRLDYIIRAKVLARKQPVTRR